MITAIMSKEANKGVDIAFPVVFVTAANDK